ncbi:MAG: FtsQ-type POTRA domain-containing protein [Ignavibacteria bacterium]
MDIKNKLTGILIFIALLLGVVYIILFSKIEKKMIEKIEISGNYFLSKEEYFNFTKLNKNINYKFLSPSIIRDRFEKHPYVLRANVKYVDENSIQINLTERKFQAILLVDSLQFLITEQFMVVPFFLFTKNMVLPVIENPLLTKKIRCFDIVRTPETKAAFRIIDASKIISTDIYSNLTDIDLRQGKDIVLRFRGYDFQVIFGRNGEVEKLMSFEKVWNHIHNQKENPGQFINYVDLRYEKLIYVGMDSQVSEVKGTKG